MARKKNPLESVSIRFSGNRVIVEYLSDLVKTGLYGRTPGEAAERLVSQGLERLIEQRTLSRRSGTDNPPDRSGSAA